MLFAGGVAGRKCPECDAEYTLVASASVLFYILLIRFGSAYIVDPVQTLVGTRIAAIIASVVLTSGLIVVLCVITDAMKRSVSPLPDECPDCETEMVQYAGRFDSLTPTLQDVLIFVGFGGALWFVQRLL